MSKIVTSALEAVATSMLTSPWGDGVAFTLFFAGNLHPTLDDL